MQCPNCHHENPADVKFCGACGTKLERLCENCGASNPLANKFCHQCGQSLTEPPPQPSPVPLLRQTQDARDKGGNESRFASPQSYTPPFLAQKILASRSALEGERKQVTVLFADLAGSTTIEENLDPEDVHRMMNRAFELMLDEVHRYEGTVNQFLGDGIMALFGAPIAHEDHAQRAVHAALGIQRALTDYQAELQRTRGIDFRMRVGLNTGLVMVGSIGDNLRMDYTAMGDTTNLASRMMSLAEPGQIVVAEDTYKAVGGYFVTAHLGEQTVKGKSQPVKAYAVIRAREPRTRFDVGLERGLTPYVGREKELALLHDRFAEAKAGRGQIVSLMGEPGIGKSRLLLEFRRALEFTMPRENVTLNEAKGLRHTDEILRSAQNDKAANNFTWLTGRCISYGKTMAYMPIIDITKQNFRVEEDDDEATIISKIERGTLALGEELHPFIPYFKYLLSVNPGDESVLSMDAQQRRLKVFEALRAIMLKGAQVRPLVLAIEDLHWMDKTSEDLLLYLADSLATARVLLLLTYRPGYANPFGEQTYTTRLVLHTLSADESIQLAEGALATRELPDELCDLITRKAEGNPFFVEEVIKSLVEAQALKQQDERYVLMKAISEIEVPDTIQDVLMARIDRLDEAPKRALQLASVIGREFTVRLLDRISDVQGQLERFLLELKVLEFIYEQSFYPELAYMFKHALTHDVAYNSLLIQRRKQLHALVGDAIEELYAERLAEYYEMLAYHYECGEVWAKALEYLVKAAQKLQGAYASREALDHYDRALAVCERLGEAVELATRMTIFRGKGTAHNLLSEFVPAAEAYQRMLETAQRIGERSKEAEALYQIGFNFYWAHEFEKALEYAERAKAVALESGDKHFLAASLFVTANVRGVTGELSEAIICFQQALEISREAEDKFLEGFTLIWLGLIHNWKGEYEQSLPLQEQAFTIGQSLTFQFSLLQTFWNRGLVCSGNGQYYQAIDSLQNGITFSERLGDKILKCRMLNSLGWVYGELYNLEPAIRYNQEGVALAYKIGDPEIIRNAEINLGDDYMMLGDLAQAQYWLEKVYRDSQQRGKWGEEWMKWRYMQHCCHSLGELRLMQGDAESALALAEACLQLAEPTQSRKNIVKGWRLKGQVFLVQNKIAEAEEALNKALAIAKEIGNPPQLWKTYAALSELHARKGEAERARAAYTDALQVIDEVAGRLQDVELKRTFLAAKPVREIREKANASPSA